MSDETALLAAVCAHPDEDTPRLAYADWLDEHADALSGRDPAEVRARAEFIRLQIAFDGRDGDSEFDDPRDRAAALYVRHRAAWEPPGADRGPFWEKVRPTFWTFRRGFAEHPHIAPELFAEHAAALCAVAPVRHLGWSLTAAGAEALARCPHIRQIRALDLSPQGPLTEFDLRRFLMCPHLTGLRELKLAWLNQLLEPALDVVCTAEQHGNLEKLSLWQYQFTVPVAAALAQSKTVRLRRLTGFSGDAGDVGMRLLAASPACQRLEVLHLTGCQITASGAQALAGSPHLGPVWNLSLWGNRIGTEGAEALAACPRLSNLRTLDLGYTRLGLDGLAALAHSEHLDGLRAFDLRYNALRAGAGKVLAEGPAFARLLNLDLARNGIGDGGATHLGNSCSLNELRRLNLAKCSIKETGFQALVAGSGLPALTHLDLGGNRIAGGVAALSDVRYPNLRVLKLNRNFIDDAGAVALARSPQLASVEELDLASNKITDAGAKALMESPHLTKVRRLEFTRNKLSRAMKAAFEKRFAPTPA